VIDAIAKTLKIEAYQTLDHNDLGAAILKGIGALQADEKHMEECAVLFDGVLGEIGEELGVDCREEADDPEFHAELLAALRALKANLKLVEANEEDAADCAGECAGVLLQIGEELGVSDEEFTENSEFHAALLAAFRDLKTADRAVGAIHSLAAALGMEGLEGDGPAVICGKILARADQLKARVDLAAKGGVSLAAVQMTEALLADQLEAIAFLRHEHQVVSRLAQELKSGLLDVAEAAGFADPDRYTIADLVARIKGALSRATP
jgi:hypothetical protein